MSGIAKQSSITDHGLHEPHGPKKVTGSIPMGSRSIWIQSMTSGLIELEAGAAMNNETTSLVGLVILIHIIQWQHGPGLVEESSSQSQNGQALLVSSLGSNHLLQHRTPVQNILMFQWRTQNNIGGRWQGNAIANASLTWHNKTWTLLGLSDTTKLKLPAHLTKSLGFSLNA